MARIGSRERPFHARSSAAPFLPPLSPLHPRKWKATMAHTQNPVPPPALVTYNLLLSPTNPLAGRCIVMVRHNRGW